MRTRVLVGGLQKVRALYSGLARNRSGRRADLAGHVGVCISRRNERETGETTAIEFVDHQTLEGVPDRVDVVDPAEPYHHAASRDGEASVDDEGQNENGGGSHSLGNGS